jgi:hypothetical protein
MNLKELNQMLVETGVLQIEPELTADDILNQI